MMRSASAAVLTVLLLSSCSSIRPTAPSEASTVGEGRQLESTIAVYDLETGTTRDVLSARAHYEAPNWTPDGRYLLFNSEGKLYRVPPTGGAPELIDTDPLDRLNNDHGITPDGSTLILSNGDGHIYTMPYPGGGAPHRVTDETPSYWHGVSPDGRQLAYIANRGESYDIYLIPIEGGQERPLVPHPAHEDGSDYTPDGAYIYFNSDRSGNFDIWRVRPDGTSLEQITDDAYEDWFPHPSPDGEKVVFLSYEPGTEGHPPNRNVRLRVMTPEGEDIEVLTEFLGGQGTINVPSWSPDSESFAFVYYRLHDS